MIGGFDRGYMQNIVFKMQGSKDLHEVAERDTGPTGLQGLYGLFTDHGSLGQVFDAQAARFACLPQIRAELHQ